MGDSILASLSLPPSGRIPSNPSTGAKTSRADQSNSTQRADKTAFITPVIGLISNEDVPVMVRKTDATNEHPHPKKNLKYTGVKERQTKDGEERVEAGERHLKTASEGGIKRKQPDQGESESEEVEEVVCISSSGEESVSMSLRNVASATEPSRSGGSRGAVESERRALEGCLTRLGVRRLHLPDDPFLCSVFVTCLKSQPRVEVDKMTLAGDSSYAKRPTPRRRSPAKAAVQSHSRPLDPELEDKE